MVLQQDPPLTPRLRLHTMTRTPSSIFALVFFLNYILLFSLLSQPTLNSWGIGLSPFSSPLISSHSTKHRFPFLPAFLGDKRICAGHTLHIPEATGNPDMKWGEQLPHTLATDGEISHSHRNLSFKACDGEEKVLRRAESLVLPAPQEGTQEG